MSRSQVNERLLVEIVQLFLNRFQKKKRKKEIGENTLHGNNAVLSIFTHRQERPRGRSPHDDVFFHSSRSLSLSLSLSHGNDAGTGRTQYPKCVGVS